MPDVPFPAGVPTLRSAQVRRLVRSANTYRCPSQPLAHEPWLPAGEAPVLAIEINGLRQHLWRAGRLFAESALIPTALLAGLLHVVGLRAALAAAVGWCALTALVRWVAEGRVPGTLLLCASVLAGRSALALVTSSAVVYLLQPVVGSSVMAALFVGSALVGRPVTVRLARDFVHVPSQLLRQRGVRRMFSQVALLWGGSRLIDAGMSLGFLSLGVEAGLLSRAVLSPVLTVLTVVVCTLWGRRALRREGVRLSFSSRGAAVNAA
jgi:hypothetical protein